MKIELMESNVKFLNETAEEQGTDIGSVLMMLDDIYGPMLERYSIDFLSSFMVNKDLPRAEVDIPDEVIETYKRRSGVGDDFYSAVCLVCYLYDDHKKNRLTTEDCLRNRVGFVLGCLGLNSCLEDLLFFPELAPHVDAVRSRLEEIRSMDPWEAADIAEKVFDKMMHRIRNTHSGLGLSELD